MSFRPGHIGVIAALTVSLAACSAPEGTSPTERRETSMIAPQTSEEAGRLILSGEGGRTTGDEGKRLYFGQSQDQVTAILSENFGSMAPLETNEECGAGPVDFLTFSGGVTLNFQRGNFVGWFLSDVGPGDDTATPEGIAPGSTMADARAVYAVTPIEGSTLGDEFSADEGIGIFAEGPNDADTITGIYAGVNCFFR